MHEHEEIYIITDGCAWEQNKQNDTYYPHAMEVVNIKTGQVKYIKCGSRIAFIEGEITEGRSQEEYNKVSTPTEVSSGGQDKLQRADLKKRSRKDVSKKPV